MSQGLEPYDHFAGMIRRHSYCTPGNKVSLGLVDGLNGKIRVFERRAYGLKDGEYLCLKVVLGRFRCWLRRNHRHISRTLHNFWDVRTNSGPLAVLYSIVHLARRGGPVIGGPSGASPVIRDLSHSDPMAKWLRRGHSLIREGSIQH